MALSQALYRTVLRALRALSPAMMGGESKLARGLRGRRDSHERLVAWGSGLRAGPAVVWVHASSVGESIQARAVVEVLRRRTPELRVLFTFFSPSAERVREDFPADISAYLPWDLPDVMGPVLDAVRPSVIVFTQREVWPTLADEARARGVPTLLIAATLPEGAGRLGVAGRLLLGAAFRSLRAVAAVSVEDAERFGVLGVESDHVTVTGDPAIDAVRCRVAGIDRGAPHMRVFGDARGPILVAGSTWPSDDEVLVPALARVRESVPGLRIVLAPHEPDGYDFVKLERLLAADGWTPALLGKVEAGAGHGADVILVDRVGVLADLYSLGSVAYVGGGFQGGGFRGGLRRGGLHSVLEPAAAASLVLMGPRHRGSTHAARLLASGAARAVGDVEALVHALEAGLGSPRKNEDAGQRAIGYIEDHRGSAERTADLITRFLPQQDRRGTLSRRKT